LIAAGNWLIQRTRLVIPSSVFLLYLGIRLFLFLSTAVVTNQDTWAFVASEDDLREIVESKSTRPGFIYQLLLRGFPIAEGAIFTQDAGLRAFQYEGIPAVAVMAFVVSILCWSFLAAVTYKITGPHRQGQLMAASGVLAISLLPAVWVWDNIVVSETLAISFTIGWLASFIMASQISRNPYIWFFASLIFMFLSFGVRPSNAPVMIGASVFFLALVLPGALKSRAFLIGWLTSAWFISNIASRTLQISERWTGIWGGVVDANRSTAFLILPNFVQIVEARAGRAVCDSSMNFVSTLWRDGNYGSWGGVTEASVVERGATGCIGGWEELGKNAPSFLETLLSPGIQAQWWVDVFPHAMDPLPGPLLLDHLQISPILVSINSVALGQGWLSLAAWALAGALIGWFFPTKARLSEIFLLAVTGAGSLAGFWLLASLDGGAFDRHGAPYNLIIPVIIFLVSVLTSGIISIRLRNFLRQRPRKNFGPAPERSKGVR